MAYIGIVGPYAIGKTTAINCLVDWLKIEQRKLRHAVVCVNCDNNREREWFSGELEDTAWKSHVRWKGTADEKSEELDYCFGDETGLWVCETNRTDHIRLTGGLMDFDGNRLHKRGRGGEFIVLTCGPDALRQFLIDRCVRANKQFRADYWDHKRLVYECHDRYINAARRYLDPIKFPYKVYNVDPERRMWDEIMSHLIDSVQRPIESWYK